MTESEFERDFNQRMRIPCPACMEPMHMAAQRCPNCQKEFSSEEVKAHVSAHSKKSVPGCIALLVAGAAIIMIGKSVIDQSPSSEKEVVDASGMTDSDRRGWEYFTRERVSEQLREPESAIFSDLEVHARSDQQTPVVCGRVNSRNGFGGMSGPQRFIAIDGITFEQQAASEVFQQSWALHCN